VVGVSETLFAVLAVIVGEHLLQLGELDRARDAPCGPDIARAAVGTRRASSSKPDERISFCSPGRCVLFFRREAFVLRAKITAFLRVRRKKRRRDWVSRRLFPRSYPRQFVPYPKINRATVLSVPDDDHGMKRSRNTATQIALSPKAGINEQERRK
jgi:hypothetical protein